MTFTTYKIYNRVTHSYLAVFKTEKTGDEDPAIFVCYDRSIDTCPEESSGSSSESSTSEELPSSADLSEGSSEEISSGDTSSEEASFMEGSSSDTSSSEDFTEIGVPLYEIFSNRTLVAIASLTDLLVHPLVAPQGELYRADTVAMLFRSKRHMNQVFNEICQEVKINARLQRVDIQNTEVVELNDPGNGLDTSSDYYFLT